MEYRLLNDVTIQSIHQAFLDAFSSYIVPMNMPLQAFETMLKRNGFSPKLSIGAFKDEKLVGFILNGVREVYGRRVIYDTGTGVLPSFSGTGIGSVMLEKVDKLCVEEGIYEYYLEVIQGNENAVNLYKKQGFHIKRNLGCYIRKEKGKESFINTKCELYHLEKMEEPILDLAASFWDYPPSWQNSKEAVTAVKASFDYVVAEIDGDMAGYGIVNKTKGDIAQIAVSSSHRRKGIATLILQEMQKSTESTCLTINNVDDRNDSLKEFLKRMGFQEYVKQYEMVKDIK